MPYISQRDIRKANGWANLKELSQRLGVPISVAEGFRTTHPPEIGLGKQACWSKEQVEQITRELAERPLIAAKTRNQREAAGYWSVYSACHRWHISTATWYLAISWGRIPAPTHRIGRTAHYTTDEAEAIVEYFRKRNDRPEHVLGVSETAKLLGYTKDKVSRLCRIHGLGTATDSKRWLTNADIARLVRLLGAK